MYSSTFKNEFNTYRILLLRLFLALGETINLHAKIVSRLLPIDLTVGYVKQVLVTYLIAAGIRSL